MSVSILKFLIFISFFLQELENNLKTSKLTAIMLTVDINSFVLAKANFLQFYLRTC